MNDEKSHILGQNNEKKTPEWLNENTKAIAKEVIIFVFIIFGVLLPFRKYVAEPYLVDGRSMDPTFETGDYLIVDKISYRFHEPERNSVVVLNATNAGKPEKSFIKRIIGLPGETVVVKDNTVEIFNSENPNGFMLDQSYVKHPWTGSYQVTLSGDQYFVMGDNRAESYDSRMWGPLNKKYIKGKPILRLLPLSEIGKNPGTEK